MVLSGDVTENVVIHHTHTLISNALLLYMYNIYADISPTFTVHTQGRSIASQYFGGTVVRFAIRLCVDGRGSALFQSPQTQGSEMFFVGAAVRGFRM
jgi:hypothetical protein